jgi:hypothetical protein
MALQQYAGFVGPAYKSASFMADDEQCINLYPEQIESPAPASPWCLMPCPGFTTLTSVPQAPGRGHYEQGGLTLFIAGFAFYEYNVTANTTTLRGTVQADQFPATFSSNGDAGGQIFITSGDQGYIYDVNTHAFTTVLNSGARFGDYLDGYFLALDATTSTLQISNLLDGLTWNPLLIAQRTAGSDPWKAMKVCNRLIYLLGEQTSEVWWNDGSFPFPFAPIQEAFMEQGIGAPFSLALLESDNVGSLLWVTNNAQGRGMVVRTNGYTPGRVSTHAIEFALQGYSDTSDIIADGYQEQGHPFYVMTAPTGDQTWAYDARTSLWHERASWDIVTGTKHASRGMWFSNTGTQNLSLDRNTGAIYTMATTIYTDVGGAVMRRVRQPPRLSFGQKRFTTNFLQIVMDVGQGLITGQGDDPTLMLQSSRDGGKTFSAERWKSAGAIGRWDTRVVWHQLGQARNRVDRFVMTDPVPWRLTDALIDVNIGAS